MKIRFRVDEVAERLEIVGAATDRRRVRHTILRPMDANVSGQIELVEHRPPARGFVAGTEVEIEVEAVAKDDKKEAKKK